MNYPIYAPRRVIAGVLPTMIVFVMLVGCNAARFTGGPAPTLSPATGGSIMWQALDSGIERREISLAPYQNGSAPVLRIDPAAVTFRVHYSPGAPHSLAEWRDALPGAWVIVNANFFDENDRALGLLVSDGQAFGSSFTEFGGMFAVSAAGVRVRSLVAEPYQGEPLLHAAQAFPVLIEAGGVLAPRGDGFDTASRRTWIGQDVHGRILIGVTQFAVSLAELQQWLLSSDLSLHSAFALDGGRSSGLVITVPDHREMFPAFDRLPAVIAVYPN